MHLRNEIEHGAIDRQGWPYARHPSSRVDPSSVIFPGAYIGPNVTIGRDCVIGPNATIGAPGFGYDHVVSCGYSPNCEGNGCSAGCEKVWRYRTHTAGVVIKDDVHIGAGANIAQGRWRPTTIYSGARIDAHCHIAHNVVVGRNVAIAASSMLAGSVTVGDGAYIAPGASVRDNRTIGEGATVGLGAAVVCDVPANETWAGVPARRMAQ